jgi:hypothetical protein
MTSYSVVGIYQPEDRAACVIMLEYCHVWGGGRDDINGF